MLNIWQKNFFALQIAAASILVSCEAEMKVTVATKDCADKNNPKCKKSGAVEPADTSYFNVNAPTWTWEKPSKEAEFTVSFSDTPPSRSVPGSKALSYTPSIRLPDGNYTVNVWSRALASQDWVIYARIKSVIDTSSPVVTGITSATADGAYGAGASIDVIVGFSEVVYVTGTPTLKLGVMPNQVDALYQSGSGQLLQVFRYTVGAADRAAKLDVASDSALSVTAGSFKDIAGNDAVLTVPTGIGENGSLAKNSNIVISTAPFVLSVTTTKAGGNYKAGVVIPIIVEFSKAVTVSGTPRLILETGTSDAVVDFVSVVDGTKMQFDYTVRAGDTSSDLDYLSANALSLNSGSITDSLNNNAILLLPDPNSAGSLAGQKTLIIDTSAPTISFNSFTPASPGMDQTPIVRGTTSEPATILLYSDGLCSNPPPVDAERNTVFASPGITTTSLTSFAQAHMALCPASSSLSVAPPGTRSHLPLALQAFCLFYIAL